MKKAALLIVLFSSMGFISRVLDCVELECCDSVIVSNLVSQLGWSLCDALLTEY
jgi:hypothetical protein